MKQVHGLGKVIPAALGLHEISGGDGFTEEAKHLGGVFHIQIADAAAQLLRHKFEVGRNMAEIHGQVTVGQRFAIQTDVNRLHLVAELLQQFDAVLNGGNGLSADRAADKGGTGITDTQFAQGLTEAFEIIITAAQRVGTGAIGACDHIQHGGAVTHTAGEYMLGRRTVPEFLRIGAGRHPATAWLEAKQTTAGGRNTDRTAAITTGGHWHNAGGNRCGRTTAGAARGVIQIPGIARRAKGLGFGDAHQPQFRRVGFTKKHQTAASETAGQFAVAW